MGWCRRVSLGIGGARLREDHRLAEADTVEQEIIGLGEAKDDGLRIGRFDHRGRGEQRFLRLLIDSGAAPRSNVNFTSDEENGVPSWSLTPDGV
jgi:hypothetical protein